MKKYFVSVIFLLSSSLSLTPWADNHTADQQKKIQQIQQSVHLDLIVGDIDHARNQLDEAAGNFHSEEIELAIIQTLMQAGEYRHALSAAAHTQAEHPDFSDATLFYAWLLAIGGQTQPAKNLLTSSLEQHPSSDLATLLAQINNSQLNSRAFTSENFQLAPITDTKSLKSNKFLASGILINATHVMTSRVALAKHKHFFTRNGLGRMFKAHIDETFSDAYLARLIIENPAPILNPIEIIDKMSFPGTPVYSVGFAHDAKPNWPQLLIDILGSPVAGKEKLYSLNAQNIDDGTGLYNLSGLLVGIVVSDGSGSRKVRMIVNDSVKTNEAKPARPRIPADQVYENALQTSVQLFTDN
jgi:tetratricopeptide (TPR) repeat protein